MTNHDLARNGRTPERSSAARRGRSRLGALMAGGLLLITAPVLTGLPAEAQTPTPAPPQDGPVALSGVTIHPVTTPVIENGTVLFEDGVITAMGTDVELPAGTEILELPGRHVYPGLIDANSSMGLSEIGGFDVAIDLNELGDVNPNARAHVAFNPETRHTTPARSQGVLITNSSPSGGLISGLSAAMMLDGWTWEEMTLKESTNLMLHWPSPQDEDDYEAELETLRSTFDEARGYMLALEAEGEALPSDARWEAMIPVLQGEVPIMIQANELRQIQDAITWSEEEEVRIMILGGRDAAFVADHLAGREIPVILSSVQGSPSRGWQPYDEPFTLPLRLHEAGVPFAIAGGSSAPYTYRLPWEAGTAVAFGLSEEEALRAVTLYPARFLGIDDRVGSLGEGMDATLLVTTGSPLEYETQIEGIYIQGRAVEMDDIHRLFYQKYRQRIEGASDLER